jgi:cytochrome c2
MRRVVRSFAAGLVVAVLTVTAGVRWSPPARALDPAQLVEQRCTVCHGIDQVYRQKRSPDGWRGIVTRMAGYEGSDLSRVDQLIIIKYLETNYGNE